MIPLPSGLDITAIEAAGGLVLAAAVGVWGVQKVIGMVRDDGADGLGSYEVSDAEYDHAGRCVLCGVVVLEGQGGKDTEGNAVCEECFDSSADNVSPEGPRYLSREVEGGYYYGPQDEIGTSDEAASFRCDRCMERESVGERDGQYLCAFCMGVDGSDSTAF